jgi:hypothetical protein
MNFYETFNRDRWNANPYLVPFSLKIKLPPLRKARRIIERNKLGRIVKTRAPHIKTHHFSG